MANHKSSLKRIRQTETRRLHNRYYAKTMRNAVRKLRAMTDKTEATAFLPKVQTMLDKLAKNNIIHKNKAANIKSSVTLHVNSLGWSLSARKHIAELRKEVRFFVFIGLFYYAKIGATFYVRQLASLAHTLFFSYTAKPFIFISKTFKKSFIKHN